MDNNQKISNKSIFFIIIAIALIIISGTFAWLSYRSKNTAMVLTIGEIDGLSVTLKPYQIQSSLSPVSTYQDGIVIDVTADNKNAEEDNFKLFYKINTIDDSLKSSDFKYTITKCTANCDNANNYSVLSQASGNFVNASSNSNLDIYKENVPANTTYKYKVYLWIDSSGGNQSAMQNKVFNGELRASVSETLYTLMRDNAIIDNISSTYVTNANGVQFSDNSSDMNGKGIYMRSGTENDTYPIYYYRGEVNNNNVLFGGFCWKIVRTTSTGGTKIIYNGLPTGTNSNQCENTIDEATQLANTSVFNEYDNSLADIGYMYGTRYVTNYKTMYNNSATYMYGTDYDESTHKLLTTNAMNIVGTDWPTYYNQLSNNHYTCFNASGECNKVYYIVYTNRVYAYYVQIPSGKTISDMVDEMLTSSTNTTNSKVKTVIDAWYASNMTNYTPKLEDTPYCNDRALYQIYGLDPTGNPTNYVYFAPYQRTSVTFIPSFTCNVNDAFTVDADNGNGKLTYPVGLLTTDEIMLAGAGSEMVANSNYYLYTHKTWWSSSPFAYFGASTEYVDFSTGANRSHGVSNSNGVRPVVSLKHGTKFVFGGDGTSTNPYVVE